MKLILAFLALTSLAVVCLHGQILPPPGPLEGLLTPRSNLRGDPDEFVSSRVQTPPTPQSPVTQTRRHARNETAVRNLREADRLETEESRSHPRRHKRPYSRSYKKPKKASYGKSGTDDFDSSDSYEGSAGYSTKTSYNRANRDSYQDSDHKTIRKNDKEGGKGKKRGDHIGSRRVREYLYGGFGFDF